MAIKDFCEKTMERSMKRFTQYNCAEVLVTFYGNNAHDLNGFRKYSLFAPKSIKTSGISTQKRSAGREIFLHCHDTSWS